MSWTLPAKNQGAAYIFKKISNSWIQIAKLTASDWSPDDGFGWSVSIFDKNAIVGASNDYPYWPHPGSAYIFQETGNSWVQVAKLTASDGAVGDAFGLNVAISDYFVIVGAPYDDDNGDNSGSAYIFDLAIPVDIPRNVAIPLLLLNE